jgi:hypothetical protein
MTELETILRVDLVQLLQGLLERKVLGTFCDEQLREDEEEAGEVGLEELVINPRLELVGEPDEDTVDELHSPSIILLTVVQ